MDKQKHPDEEPEPEVYRSFSGDPADYPPSQDRISPVQLANVLLRHRWTVLGLPVIVAAFVVVWTVIQPPAFTANASFVPQTGDTGVGQLARFSGVASQFGIDIPAGQAGQSPQFYADLLTSRRLLEEAVVSRYSRAVPPAGESEEGAVEPPVTPSHDSGEIGRDGSNDVSGDATLLDLYEVKANSRPAAVAAAADRLNEAITVSTDTETGVVELSVKTRWPAVSKQIAERLIGLVNDFNNRVRQTRASAQAEFVSERLEEARRELREAEDSLETFLERNVGWQQSPALRFEHDRLQRRVSLKQEVYTSLASRYEEARIDEVRSTPVVTNVTEAQVPPRPDSRQLRLKAVLGLIVGGMIGVLWAFSWEYVRNFREHEPEDFREFASLTGAAADDLDRLRRRFRRMLQGDASQ